MPLLSVDYGGGIIITDWYSEENENDAIKITIQFLSNEVRSNSLNIKIFKRKVTESGLLEESQLEEIEKNIKKEIEEAVSESKEAKYPAESDLLTDVYVKY